jgi:hypothetical protein
MACHSYPKSTVIPAKAGIHGTLALPHDQRRMARQLSMDPGVRRGDDFMRYG